MAIKSNVYVNITDSSIQTNSTSINKSNATATNNVSQMLDDIMISIENKADKNHKHDISQILDNDIPMESVDADWIDDEWEKD